MNKLDEVVEALSFPVVKVPVFIQQGENYVEGVGCNVVRTDTNQAIAQVSSTYGLIGHGTALKPVLAAVDGLQFKVSRYYMDHFGKSVMVKAFSEKSWVIGKLKNGKEDEVKLTLLLINSYDRTTALRIAIAGERLVCKNGMTVSHPAFYGLGVDLKVVHSQHQIKKLDIVSLGNQVSKLYSAMDAQAESWRKMKNTQVSLKALADIKEKVLLPVVGKRNLDSVSDLVFNGTGQDGNLTLWSLYNGITEHYSRAAEKSKTPVSAHTNLYRKSKDFLSNLDEWTNANTEQLVTVNA